MTQDRRSNRMKPNCLSGRGVDARAATATGVAEQESNRWIQTMMIAWRRGRRGKSLEAAHSLACLVAQNASRARRQTIRGYSMPIVLAAGGAL
jgi:hypothetical protein